MIQPVRFRPQTKSEVLEARSWYDGRRQGLGAEFGVAVDGLVTRIAENPLVIPRARGDIHCLVLEVARKAGHVPLGTFDRDFGKRADVEQL